jgi:hypothetical protein
MSDTENIKMYAIQGTITLVVIIGIILFGVFIFRKSSDNGASVLQMFIGKKIGGICTSDAMCGTNKCRNNICVY